MATMEVLMLAGRCQHMCVGVTAMMCQTAIGMSAIPASFHGPTILC